MSLLSRIPFVGCAQAANAVLLGVIIFGIAAGPSRVLSAETVHLCCTPEDCIKGYRVRPNLVLKARTHIIGYIELPAGGPSSYTRVELRKWISPGRQVSLRSVMTDAYGRFDAGQVEKGRYRLLPSAVNYMSEPEHFACPAGECDLQILLRSTTTDTVQAQCPVR